MAGPVSYHDVATADFDRDGDPQIFTVAYTDDLDGTIAVFLGDGAGGFADRPASPVARAVAVTVGDLNGDGACDLVSAQP